MRGSSPVLLIPVLAARVFLSPLDAQTPPLPQTYSFTEMNSLMVPDLMLKVYRDGAKEVIDQTRPASAANPKGFHVRNLYDFQAHKIYTWDLIETARPCSVSEYADSTAPPETDVIAGSAAMAADLAKEHPKTVGNETVNGIAARVLEVADPAGGSTKVWMSEKSSYVIKWVTIPKSGAPRVQLEISNLVFAKPRASVFTLPSDCK